MAHGRSAHHPATQGLSTEVMRGQPDGSWMFVIDNPNPPR